MGHAELQPEDIDESVTALKGAMIRTWTDFCATTSIHGLKYTRDEETNKYVRFVWYIISLISFICAVLMVYTFYVDYRSNPTRMNVENDYAPISNLHFPPTIICPEVMFNTQKSGEFLKTLNLPESLSVSNVSSLLANSYGFMYDDQRFDVKNLELLDEVLELNNFHIVTFMARLSWNCEDLLYRCRFQNRIVPCNTLFQTVRSSSGFCCGFNMNQTGAASYSNKKASGGFHDGLSLILYYNDTMYDRIKSYSLGFKVMLQETNAFPSSHSVNKFIPLNEEVFVSVRPIETFSSAAVKKLAFEERQCVYATERRLTFFRNYVGANCELNCRVRMMVKHCGCYTYFFDSNRTKDRICTFRDIPCLVDNYAITAGRLRKYQCLCYNPCEKIEYVVDATSAPLDLTIPTGDVFYDDLKEDFAALHVYVNSDVYRRIRHDLLSNMVTLVSNLGSAFSLFVGMSMVSAVEIMYYFTVILKKYYRQECNAREKLFIRKQPALKDEKTENAK